MRIAILSALAIGGLALSLQTPAMAQAQTGLSFMPNSAPSATQSGTYYNYYNGNRARTREYIVSPRIGEQG